LPSGFNCHLTLTCYDDHPENETELPSFSTFIQKPLFAQPESRLLGLGDHLQLIDLDHPRQREGLVRRPDFDYPVRYPDHRQHVHAVQFGNVRLDFIREDIVAGLLDDEFTAAG